MFSLIFRWLLSILLCHLVKNEDNKLSQRSCGRVIYYYNLGVL